MHLVIIGGTAAGMSCAARARRLDEKASITVLESTRHVSSASCGLPYYVSGTIPHREALEVETPETLLASLNIDVRLGSTVTGLDPAERAVQVSTADGERDVPYDALVIATGTRAALPPVPGLDSPRVHTLRTIGDAVALREVLTHHSGPAPLRALVIGAGFIGLEAAENLADAGAVVTIVDGGPHPLSPLDADIATYAIQALAALGVSSHMSTTVVSLSDEGGSAVAMLSDGTRVEADAVVVATGVRPNSEPFVSAGVKADHGWIDMDAHGRTSLPSVWAVGDVTLRTDAVTGARHPLALAGPSNRDGRLVADAILSPDSARPLPSVVGTAIVRIGRTVIGMTGASGEALDRASIPFHTLHLQPSQHAGYYPGAQDVDLRVHVGADGRLLGAQAAGGDGVDKRIDVLATAIRAGMRAEDLIDLDLAYAPPFGSAKDPVNFVGYMADDLSTGMLRQTEPEQLPAAIGGMMILDVRTPAEFDRWHLPGAINIPHTRMRERLDEVRANAAGRRVLVVCASGKRAYLAHRVLESAGIDSTVLAGGMNTLERYL
ncbi:FAD-dependent oxidoreductase [uncultured Bifidobacterium sp.]|uniref:FAD-dependent oxidoreductase n=1 Tax=uncultured Bifidobacterium sp. TaxID=165187 RepID=UPI0028DCB609|nr:FAD-dependent oxidoreductase [uncultured Bifidobacterium sp.]